VTLKLIAQRLLRAAWVVLAFVAGLLIITLTSMVIKHVAPVRGRKFLLTTKRLWCVSLVWILGVRIKRQGQQMAAPGLMVSNHISWLDIIVLGTQGHVSFVAKQEVAEWPVVGYLAGRSGTLFLRRGDRDSAREVSAEMSARIRAGEFVVFFPEGTSSNGASVLRFHGRLFQPALDAGVDVQAIGIAYRGAAHSVVPFVGDDEFLPNLWRVMALPEIQVDLYFCPPVASVNQDRKGLADCTHQQIRDALHLD